MVTGWLQGGYRVGTGWLHGGNRVVTESGNREW